MKIYINWVIFGYPRKKRIAKSGFDLDRGHSLEHVHPEQLINVPESFYECLNECGRIFIEIPYDIKNNDFIIPHTLFFETEGIVNLFKKFKFKIVSISEINTHNKREKN